METTKPSSTTSEEVNKEINEEHNNNNTEELNNIIEEKKKPTKEEKKIKRKERREQRKELQKTLKKQKKEQLKQIKLQESKNYHEQLESTLNKEEFKEMIQKEQEGKISRISRQKLEKEALIKKLTTTLQNGMNSSTIGCCVDCSFNEYMNEREINSLAQQLSKCYAAYKRMKNPIFLQFTSLQGALYNDLKFFEGFPDRWLMKINSEHFIDIYRKEEEPQFDLIYLSADSDNEIDEFKPGTIYIIGGIIDKNRHKNLCNQLAIDKYKLKTAKFPIDKHVQLKCSSVLTTNQCVEIISTFISIKEEEQNLTNDEIWSKTLNQ
ncbi:hypothetical protein ABK040_004132 [Willaertia magna]